MEFIFDRVDLSIDPYDIPTYDFYRQSQMLHVAYINKFACKRVFMYSGERTILNRVFKVPN